MVSVCYLNYEARAAGGFYTGDKISANDICDASGNQQSVSVFQTYYYMEPVDKSPSSRGDAADEMRLVARVRCRRPAGDVRALRPVWQGGLCGSVAGAAGRRGRGRCAPGRILAAMAQSRCVRRQPGKPGGMAGGDRASSVHRPAAQAAAGDRHRRVCYCQRS